MNESDAVRAIEAHCPPAKHPELSNEQSYVLLGFAAVTDVNDVNPGASGWVPTYSQTGVWRAVAEGWRMKSGNVAGDYDFTTDGQTFRRSQVADLCAAQEALYRRKMANSVPV